MSSGLDMSLDDLIKLNKRSTTSNRGGGSGGGGGGIGGRRRGFGPSHRFPDRYANRLVPYFAPRIQPFQLPDLAWQFSGQMSAMETGTKLFISNLHYGVSKEDIQELFSDVGDVRHLSVHYDRSGRSKGTAEVVFSRWEDAVAAMKRYNDVQLDGKPMKLEIIEQPSDINHVAIANPTVPFQRNISVRGGSMNGPPGGGFGRGRSRGRGRGRVRGHGDDISAEALDKDLEKYRSEAMKVD